MSDDDLLAQVKPRAQAPAAAAASPTPSAAPDYSKMSDDELLSGLAPRTSAAPERSLGQQVGRQLGLTARHAISGVAALPAMAADAVTGPINTVLDKTVGEGQGYRFPKQAAQLDKVMTQAGLPAPENDQERVVGDTTAALAGTGGVVKLGRMLTQRGAGTVARAVGEGLAVNPAMQGVSAATSAGAAGSAREAGGGEAVQLAASVAGALAPGLATSPFRRQLAPGGAQTRAAAQQANQAGFVIPPADLSPGVGTELLSGLSGKIKTAQAASAKNQPVANSLARKALGLGDDVDLNIETLDALRKQAAAAYAPVAGSGVVTPGASFTRALDDAVKPFVSQSKSFPGMKVPEVVSDIGALKSPQFDAGDALNAIRTMREGADKAYRAGEAQSGKAYRQAAAALEDALEGHLQGLGQPGADILKGFRDARQTIAKSYTVQGALNPQTGAINAIKLAADLRKGKPLSGELRTIGEFGQAFPRAAQSLAESPKAISPLDVMGAGASALGMSSVLPLGLVAARPAARSLLLSNWQQQRALKSAGMEVQRLPDGTSAIAAGVAGRAGDTTPERAPVYKNRLQAGYAARMSGGVVVPAEGGFAVVPK